MVKYLSMILQESFSNYHFSNPEISVSPLFKVFWFFFFFKCHSQANKTAKQGATQYLCAFTEWCQWCFNWKLSCINWSTQQHRIIKVGKDLEDHELQSSTQHHHHIHQYKMSWSTISIHFVNASRDGDSTTAQGSLFQCFTILSVKKFTLISNLNCSWHNLEPFPLNLSLVTWLF